eukprot:gene1936-3391_t
MSGSGDDEPDRHSGEGREQTPGGSPPRDASGERGAEGSDGGGHKELRQLQRDEYVGICINFNNSYGFLAVHGQQDIFVHKSGLGPLDELAKGDQVIFKVGEGRKGPVALIQERHGRDVALPKRRRRDRADVTAYDKCMGTL